MLNKHDRDNFKQRWNRFLIMTRYGQYDLGWGVAIGFATASSLFYIWS